MSMFNITMINSDAIKTNIYKGTTFEEGAFRIHILTTPKVGSTAQIGNRTIIPVMIDVVTEVYS